MQEEEAFDLVGAMRLGRRVGSERGLALGLIPIRGDVPDCALAVVDARRRRLHGGMGAFDELFDVSVGALTHEHAMSDGGLGTFDELVDVPVGALTHEHAMSDGLGGGRCGRAACETGGGREYEAGGEDLTGVLCVFHASTVTTPGMNARRRRYEHGINVGTPPLTLASATSTLQV
jgi:hypothetical protein